MELRQAGKNEAQADVQSSQNANIGATFSKLQFCFIIQVEKSLYNIVLRLCCVAINVLNSDQKSSSL